MTDMALRTECGSLSTTPWPTFLVKALATVGELSSDCLGSTVGVHLSHSGLLNMFLIKVVDPARAKDMYIMNIRKEPMRKPWIMEKPVVMFLAAVARPHFDANGNVVFDGKLGIWPFTYQEAAKRKSKHRDAGTIVTKVLPAVTQSVSREYMINFLLPAIKQRWPASERGTTIWIQQDNAKTHIPVDDPEFVAAAQADGWDIRLTCQPPNSPDLNILDLGSVDEIVLKVKQAFDEYPAECSNRIFLTLQACMVEVLRDNGGNRYKVPHMRKEVLQRLGTLPVTLKCTANFVKWAIDSLPDA
ncbi:hypothetical protein ACQ4PT_004375 [Festuca glaucescens]